MREDTPYMIERIIAALTYLTMGMVGFIWLIAGLFTKARLKPFLQYHIFQSIFIALGFTVLSIFIGWLSNLLSFIPIINRLVAQITFLLNMPLIFDYSLLQAVIYAILIYLAVTAFMGKYSYIPWVSDIIDQNISR
ncbi:unknown [Fusobacterium sp. CAG:439]|nr:unknown [Fusobacterium sp. CAG:439]HIT91905.1 hypothetical protein [Candidatus Stercorousia faecigallinarum]